MAVQMLKRKVLDNGRHYCEFAGLSTDTKPVSYFATGSNFLEVDTGDVYCFDEDGAAGSEWVKLCSLGGDS